MKVTFDDIAKEVDLRFDKKDKNEIYEYRLTLASLKALVDSEGYKKLKEYERLAREQIIDSGKRGTRDKDKNELSSEKWSMLDGFDQCVLMAEKLIKKLNDYIETKEEEQKEKQEDGTRYAADDE